MNIRTMKTIAKYAEDAGLQVTPGGKDTRFYLKSSDGRKFKVSIHVDHISVSELRTSKNRDLSGDDLLYKSYYDLRSVKRLLDKIA